MSQRRVRARFAAAAVCIAALGLLTACAGSPERPSQAPGGTAEVASAPPPQDVPQQAPPEKRDVVKTASMTITVADPSQAADEAVEIVDRAGGRVDSRIEDAGSGSGRATTSVILRVPSAKLTEAMADLETLGTVERAEITTEDVTAQRVDLDARIRALQTSVDRLLAIMRDATDPEALITAEDALSERQAELDSLRAQREALGDRIDYSTVDVSFIAETIGGPAPEEYQGFTGQIERGWDALVSVGYHLVLVFGLLLPWFGIVVVVGAVGYGVFRLLNVRKRGQDARRMPRFSKSSRSDSESPHQMP